jgi:hypothetical protein
VGTEKFDIRNRWSGEVQCSVEISCSPDALPSIKLGLAVRAAVKSDADLSGADLRGADLTDADLTDADLRGADLRGADWLPKIRNIHQAIYAAASAPGALDMRHWHRDGYCGTTHCRAGWAVVLAGEGGRVLEGVMGTNAAAALIYKASDPDLERVPNWLASNEAAMEDMRAMAEAEAAKVSA